MREATEYLRLESSQREYEPGTWRQLAIAELETDQLIGDMGICLSHDCAQAEFGLSITSSAQRKGYGVECVRGLLHLLFATTPITQVVANTDIRNLACRAVLERSGMQHVDTRQAEYKGENCTEFWYRIKRP
jgi:RimJ/RimL family protein N-acetyltransferase